MIQSVIPDKDAKSLIFSLDTPNDGYLIVGIPRELLDSKRGNFDDVFFVLVDGEQIFF